MSPAAQTLGQLESARTLALGDGRYYPTIIPGVLPIIGANANSSLEIRRWGADFLSETFASPAWPSEEKQKSALTILPTLNEYLTAVEDNTVMKGAIQTAASTYPLVYRHIISESHDSQNWQLMLQIKSNILRRLDSAPPGIRVCCVKFVQQMVLVQTPGIIADPRRPDQNEISLALVPRDHPLLPSTHLEAEASAYLDRLLDILHGDHRLVGNACGRNGELTGNSDALLVTATLNCLGMLIQRRPSMANRILTSVLNFNPLKLANSPMTPTNKVSIRSIERTTRALLVNVIKRNGDAALNARIQQYLERMHRMRIDVFDESSRKRPAPAEPTDGLDPAKRQRLGANTTHTPPSAPVLPPGPVSYKDLFLLTPDPTVANVDVQSFFKDPTQLLNILVPLLRSVDETKLGNAISTVRSRYLTLSQAAVHAPAAPGGAVDDEDEYEPDFEPEDAEQIANRLDGTSPDGLVDKASAAPLATYKLPEAPPLSEQEVQKYGDMTVRRIFGMLSAIDEPPAKTKGTKAGFNRFAANSFDRDAWITIMARLATRPVAGLDVPGEGIKSEYGSSSRRGSFSLSETIRDVLHNYIMSDWRKRMDAATIWLNEEWYNDQLQAKLLNQNGVVNGHSFSSTRSKGNYFRCTLRLLDSILPFVESTDKIILRFMSEIAEVNADVLQRVIKMADDPERVDLAIMVLQYLHMFKPPAKEVCVDALVNMWRTNDRAKPSAKKLLTKWRPEILQEEETNVKTETANGALEVQVAA
ncbi:hypothetical protein BDV96DRAFT_502484 [Lophiotrema nucula]|uniref:Symplekin/Pta1 N-terminal domain-containing protein n=1 Tax=Lophiotrema nucula TaxID=690887 RepID=A0A6A5YSQ1_9PLEO|nr:hypothetical protein BDV96DRAFT_502484 [Lophiotrema nucula]